MECHIRRVTSLLYTQFFSSAYDFTIALISNVYSVVVAAFVRYHYWNSISRKSFLSWVDWIETMNWLETTDMIDLLVIWKKILWLEQFINKTLTWNLDTRYREMHLPCQTDRNKHMSSSLRNESKAVAAIDHDKCNYTRSTSKICALLFTNQLRLKRKTKLRNLILLPCLFLLCNYKKFVRLRRGIVLWVFVCLLSSCTTWSTYKFYRCQKS